MADEDLQRLAAVGPRIRRVEVGTKGNRILVGIFDAQVGDSVIALGDVDLALSRLVAELGVQRGAGAERTALDADVGRPPAELLVEVEVDGRLRPRLGEAFGGGTGLVDLGGRKASDRASHPAVDPSLALSNTAVGANRTPVLNHHSKHNPTAEVADLFKLDVQFLPGPEPVLKEATDRRSTLEEVLKTPLKDPIFGDVAHHPAEITAIQSLKLLAHELNQVGRRGLLRHRPRSIA